MAGLLGEQDRRTTGAHPTTDLLPLRRNQMPHTTVPHRQGTITRSLTRKSLQHWMVPQSAGHLGAHGLLHL